MELLERRSTEAAPLLGASVRALACDPEGFEALRARIRAHCLRIVRNTEDADDAVQATLERGLRLCPSEGDPSAWLFTVARNICIDTLRRRSRYTCTAFDELISDQRSPCDPERDVVTRTTLAAAFRSLSPAERRAAGATWLVDESTQTASLTAGVADSTLRTLLSRARRKLSVYLDETGRSIAGAGSWLTWAAGRAAAAVKAAASGRVWLDGDRAALAAAPAVALVIVASAGLLQPHGWQPGPAATGAGTRSGFHPADPGGSSDGSVPLTLTLPRQPDGGPVGGAPTAVPGLGALHPGRVQDGRVTDMQASPSYSQDHTVLALATDSACRVPPCGELFVSRNSGHSWTLVADGQSSGLDGTQLLLPPATYAAGTFYVFGPDGLQVTHDRGLSFTTVAPGLPGFASTTIPGAANPIAIANTDLWSFTSSGTPSLEGVYPVGAQAAGPPLAVRRPAGWALLQPVQLAGGADVLLECAGGTCVQGAALPWSLSRTGLVSADGPSLLAVSPAGLAISHDYGASFASVSLPVATSPLQAVLLPGGPDGLRIASRLASAAPGAPPRLEWTDDLGRTWNASGVPAGVTGFGTMTRVDGDQLLATAYTSDPAQAHVFLCSADGGLRWSGC